MLSPYQMAGAGGSAGWVFDVWPKAINITANDVRYSRQFWGDVTAAIYSGDLSLGGIVNGGLAVEWPPTASVGGRSRS